MDPAPVRPSSKQLIHRHMQSKFIQHQDKLEEHANKSPLFRAEVERLRGKLFPDDPVG